MIEKTKDGKILNCKRIITEIENTKKINCNYVIKYIEHFIYRDHYIMVLEYCERGSLYDI